MRRFARAAGLLTLLAAAFVALVRVHDLTDPPTWRGLAILVSSLPLFRLLNRFEPPQR